MIYLDSSPDYSLPSVKLVKSNKCAEKIDFREQRLTDFFRSRELSYNTKRAYTRSFNRFLNWTDKSWHDIKYRDIDIYKQYLKDLGLKNNTISQELSALKSLFNWLVRQEYISRSPTLNLELPKIEPVFVNFSISEDEIIDFRGLVRDSARDSAILEVLLHGLRREEIANLKLDDYKQNSLFVRDAKHGSDRVVPLLNIAIVAIDDYMKERLVVNTQTDALFLSEAKNRQGQPLKSSGIYYLTKTWFQVNPHAFRHTLCSIMIERGIDPLLAMEISGHKNRCSFQRYSKAALNKKAKEAFLKLNADRQ